MRIGIIAPPWIPIPPDGYGGIESFIDTVVYRMGDGIALEPQKFPDSPNQPGFASARVDPGKPYRHIMIYRLSTAPAPAN